MNKKVLITIGVPGSGKTYLAENYKKEYSNTEIVERDVIRESLQPGYYKGKPNKEIEKQVTAIARSLISQYLEDDTTETIIISDTNLNEGRRDALQQEIKKINSNVEICVSLLSDSRNLDLCTYRNRNREKRVPEDVLCKFYRSFMSQFSEPLELEGRELIFVGDIHSQYTNLKKLVDTLGIKNHYFVFLGDINDSRLDLNYDETDPEISFIRCYELIRTMVEYGHATLVHSNHQKNLVRAIRGKRKKASWGLKSTLDELRNLGFIQITYADDTQHMSYYESEDILEIRASEEALDIANWLDTRPYYFDSGGVVGVHAQYLPEYCSNPYEVSGKGVEAAIYGTREKEGSDPAGRVRWWENYQGDTYVVSGHYHHFYVGPKCAVIDSGCGQGGPLCAFNYTTKEVHLFGVE